MRPLGGRRQLEEEAAAEELLRGRLGEAEGGVVRGDDEAVAERHERLAGVRERLHERGLRPEVALPPRLVAAAAECLADERRERPEERTVGLVVPGSAGGPDDERAEVVPERGAQPGAPRHALGAGPSRGRGAVAAAGTEAEGRAGGDHLARDGPDGFADVLPELSGRRVEELDPRRLRVEADDGEAGRGQESPDEGVRHGEELRGGGAFAGGPEEGEKAVVDGRRAPLLGDVADPDRDAAPRRPDAQLPEEERPVEPPVTDDSVEPEGERHRERRGRPGPSDDEVPERQDAPAPVGDPVEGAEGLVRPFDPARRVGQRERDAGGLESPGRRLPRRSRAGRSIHAFRG